MRVGGAHVFRKALVRKPVDDGPVFPGASGSHKGVDPANLAREIFIACAGGDGINAETYVKLHTTVDLAGLYDLLEMQQVHTTWEAAAQLNANERGEGRG